MTPAITDDADLIQVIYDEIIGMAVEN